MGGVCHWRGTRYRLCSGSCPYRSGHENDARQSRNRLKGRAPASVTITLYGRPHAFLARHYSSLRCRDGNRIADWNISRVAPETDGDPNARPRCPSIGSCSLSRRERSRCRCKQGHPGRRYRCRVFGCGCNPASRNRPPGSARPFDCGDNLDYCILRRIMWSCCLVNLDYLARPNSLPVIRGWRDREVVARASLPVASASAHPLLSRFAAA